MDLFHHFIHIFSRQRCFGGDAPIVSFSDEAGSDPTSIIYQCQYFVSPAPYWDVLGRSVCHEIVVWDDRQTEDRQQE